jgi:drug/metabolite transporter (DMT)-like permease
MQSWILDILIATIFLTASYIAIKYAFIKHNNNDKMLERVFIILALSMGTAAILILIFFHKTRENIMKDLNNFDISKWIILSGVLIFFGYYFLFKGSINAPNLGYARGVLTIDLILLTLCSIILFNAKIQLIPILGMLLILLGIVLISLYN